MDSLPSIFQAMEELNGLNLEGEPIEISLAKPVDKKKKERQLERKMQHQMGAMYARGMRGRGGRGGMAPMPMVPPMMYNGGGFVDDYYDYNLGYNNFGYGGGYEDPYYGQMQPMRGNHPGYRGGHRGMRGGIRGMTGGYFRGSRGRGKNKGRTSSFGNRGGAGKRKANSGGQEAGGKIIKIESNSSEWAEQPISQQPRGDFDEQWFKDEY